VANTGYTRNLTFTVNDKQIKRATDRLFQSLDRIEKKLDLIAGRGSKSGFKRLELGADKSRKKVHLLSAAVDKTKKTFSTLETTLRTFAGTVNVLNNVRLGFKGAVVEALNFTNALRDQEVVLKRMERATAGSPHMRNAMAGGDPLDPRGGTHPYRYFNELGTLGGLDTVQGRRRGTWQEELRNRMGIRRQALERGGTGFGSFSKDVSFHQAFRNSRGMDYGGMTSGQTSVDKSIKRHEKHLAKINKATNKTASILAKQSAGFPALPPGVGTQYGSPIGPMPATFGQRAGQWGNRLGFGKNANPQGAFANSKGMQGRAGGAVSSGLIGGGFPLLFGQSGLASILGGIGGAAGGALGGGFGFGLSIAGTAAAQKIQEIIDFRKEIGNLNDELRNMDISARVSAKEIRKLAKDLNISKEEAIELSRQFKKFASIENVNLPKIFGSRELFDATIGLDNYANTLGRIKQLSETIGIEKEFEAYKILSTQGAKAANDYVIKQTLAFRQVTLFNKEFKKQIRDFQTFGVRQTDPALGLSGRRGIGGMYSERFNKIIEEIVSENQEIQKILNDRGSYMEDYEDILKASSRKQIDQILKPLLLNNDEIKKIVQSLPEDFDLSTASAEKLVNQLSETVKKLNYIAEFQAPTEQLAELLNPMRQVLDLSVSIRDSFAQSFKDVIKGSMTAQEALANFFQKTSDHFLDMAAQIAATKLQEGFLSIFSNMFKIKGDIPFDGTRASGGSVKGGGSYIVGEKGPELFVPGSSGNIVPNHAMGGTNIVVNVDASGSSVEGDAGQSEQLGSMLAAAVQAEIANQQRPGGLLAGR